MKRIALFIISTLSLVFSAFAQTYETNYLLGNFIRAEKIDTEDNNL